MRLTIRMKLVASFAAILLLAGGAGYFGVTSLGTANDTMRSFVDRPYTQSKRLAEISSGAQSFTRALYVMIFSRDDADKAKLRNSVEDGYKKVTEVLATYRAAIAPSDTTAIAKTDAVGAALDTWLTKTRGVMDLSQQNTNVKANEQNIVQAAPVMAAVLTDIAATYQSMKTAGLTGPALDAAAILRSDIPAYAYKMMTIVADQDVDRVAREQSIAEEQLAALDTQMKTYATAAVGSPYAASAAKTLTDWGTLRTLMTNVSDLGAANTDAKAIAIIMGDTRPLMIQIIDQIQELITYEGSVADQLAATTQDTFVSTRLSLAAIVGGALLLGVIAATMMSISIARGLRAVGSNVDRIATGDVSQRIVHGRNDEIGDVLTNLCQMRLKLSQIISDVRGSAAQVASGSSQSASTAERLSSGSTEQAAASEEASAAIEEMTANVRQNADNAGTTEKIAAQASTSAEKTGAAVAASVEAMRTIAQKIQVVQEIARQTDLLALNAAIEAARAGQHGKGFAVVASEVRKLAERSQQAASEIGELSSRTLTTSEEAGQMLSALVPDIQRTAELVSEISAACREQSVGIEQINQAIQQLDQVTQANAGAANEMSATSEQLSAEAGRLDERADFFTLDTTTPPTEGADIHELQARAAAFAAQAPVRTGAAKTLSPMRPAAPTSNGVSLDLGGGFERMSA